MAVRRERVILELEDQFTGPLTRAAAATKAYERSLNDLDRTTVRTDRNSTSLGSPNGPIGSTGRQAGSASREIDRFSGRLRLLADTAAILGPALVPIGAVAIPAVTGLAAQFGAAAIAGGTAMLAFQGVGETLEAVNEAALEPSTKNLEAAQIAMQNLAPEAQAFVRQLQEMRPAFGALQEAAAAGLFPGLSAALGDVEGAFGRVEGLLYAVGDAAGDLAEDFAEGIAGPRGQEFLRFLEAEIPSALSELGHAVGNIVAGLGELWMAFTPLNNDFSGWILDISRAFDDWASGLAQTEGFREFVAYIRENGPRVADAMGSIANAVLQIVEAAAPLGGPVLEALTAVADVIGAVANSGAGPAIMAIVTSMALLNRGMRTMDAIKGSTLFTALGDSASSAERKMAGLQRAAVTLGVALAAGSVATKLNREWGAEAPPGIEATTRALLALDDAASTSTLPGDLDSMGESIDRLIDPGKVDAFDDMFAGITGGNRSLSQATGEVEALDSALANLANTQGIDASEAAFQDLGKRLGLTAGDLDKLAMEHLPRYREAIAGVQNQSEKAGAAGEEAGDRSARGFNRAKSAAEEFREAIERANRVLEGRASMRDYEQAIDDLRKSIKENGRTLDINTEKGRKNEAALDQIVSTTLKVSETMRGSNRVEFLKQARGDFIDATEKLLGGRDAAAKMWERLAQLDKTRANPHIDLNTGGAEAAISNLEQRLRNIADEDVFVNVRHTTTYSSRGRGPVGGVADGGTIGGQRFPYGDKVLAYLAPGEEVISNRHGQADRNRELLKAINSNRYASGGTVGMAPSINVAGPNVSVGGASVQVLLDSREIRSIAREVARAEISADRDFDRVMDRG